MDGPITFFCIASSSVRYSLMETGSLWLFSFRKKSISTPDDTLRRMTNLQGAAFFVAGFVFDMLLLGRVDSWHVIGQQIVYLALLTVLLVSMLREEGAPP